MTPRLPLLFALATALAAAPAAGVTLPARALVDSVAARYASLGEYVFRGVIVMDASGPPGGEPFHAVAPFLYAAGGPRRLRTEIENPGQSLRAVADGESLAVIAPQLQQVMIQPAPDPGDPAVGGPMSALLRPMGALATIARGMTEARDAGEDTVLTASGPVRCRRIEVEYSREGLREGVTVLPRALWIDETRRLLLRDSIAVEFRSPEGPVNTSRQQMRFVALDPVHGGPDEFYRIEIPDGYTRVAALGQQAPPPPPAIVGKPAKDFTLTGLKGSTVKLSALRGKVVVLDFWATWCGPCRRWMPVVAKLERELQGGDVRFYAVNEQEDRERVRAYRDQMNLTVPILMDETGSVGGDYGAQSIPLTVVIGRDGTVVQALIGVHPEEDLRAALRQAGVPNGAGTPPKGR